jgi:hypothetical protein
MWLALIPLLTQLFGESGPFGQYLKNKADQSQAQENYKLAVLKADTDAVISGNQATTDQTRDKLNATTQQFKQGTFYFLVLPIFLSVCPLTKDFAINMWHNFELIPDWYRTLFGAIYCTIWGIPLAAGYIGGIFNGIGGVIQNSQNFRLEKAKALNEQVLASELRKTLFKNGMTQEQWDAILNATKTAES